MYWLEPTLGLKFTDEVFWVLISSLNVQVYMCEKGTICKNGLKNCYSAYDLLL